MLLRRKYLLVLLLPSIFLHHAVFAQSPSQIHQQADSIPNVQPAAQPLFKATTRAVVLDVVVEDGRKHPVHGLTRNDFVLTENAQAQEIASFDAVGLTSNVSRDVSSLPHTILLIDEMNTRFLDLAYARYATEKLLSASKQLDDPTALLALTNQGLLVLQNYTQDPNQLRTALQHHRPSFPWRLSQGIDGAGERITISFRGLQSIAIANQGSGRHNNLIWISPGFPVLIKAGISSGRQKKLFDEIRDLSDELLRARMTIYTVDPRGVDMGQSSHYGSGVWVGNQLAPVPKEKQVAFSDLALSALSSQTGGRSFYGHEDVDAQIASSITEGENYYTVSYYPSNHNFDGSFRKIKVSLATPGLTARTRDGYYALPAPAPPTEKETATTLMQALLNPLNFGSIPVHLAKVSLSGTAPQGEFGIAVEGKALQWNASANGSVQCNLDIAAADFAANGKAIHLVSQPFLFVLRSTPEDAQKRVVELSLKLAVDRPAHRVRILVHDRATGYMGSMDITSFQPSRSPSQGIPNF